MQGVARCPHCKKSVKGEIGIKLRCPDPECNGTFVINEKKEPCLSDLKHVPLGGPFNQAEDSKPEYSSVSPVNTPRAHVPQGIRFALWQRPDMFVSRRLKKVLVVAETPGHEIDELSICLTQDILSIGSLLEHCQRREEVLVPAWAKTMQPPRQNNRVVTVKISP